MAGLGGSQEFLAVPLPNVFSRLWLAGDSSCTFLPRHFLFGLELDSSTVIGPIFHL